LPVVRFNSATLDRLAGGPDIGFPAPYTIFIVGKILINAGANAYLLATSTTTLVGITLNGYFFIYAGGTPAVDTIDSSNAFHCFSGVFQTPSGATGFAYVDGALRASAVVGAPPDLGIVGLMYGFSSDYYTGDIAEVLIYNSALSNTDRSNVEGYLKTKYATP
jgi:hypothetical protein